VFRVNIPLSKIIATNFRVLQQSNGDLAISMDQALIRRHDVTDDYLHSRANAMQVREAAPFIC
jgi:hypothetical protein